MALGQKPILIRGDWLCNWADSFYRGRQIKVAKTRSIVRELLSCYSFLTPDSATIICSLLKKNSCEDISVSAKEILKGCYPNPIWEKAPSKEHAAEWLLWLDEKQTDGLFEPFLKMISAEWGNYESRYQLAYNCVNPNQANELIRKWICFSNAEITKAFGKFPFEPPKKWTKVKQDYWREEITLTSGIYFLEFLEYESSHRDKLEVASQTIKYFQNYPIELTKVVYNKLLLYATGKELTQLNNLKPVDVPSIMPTEPDEVFRWFNRNICLIDNHAVKMEDNDSIEISVDIAKIFAEWYLEYYPIAIAKGKYLTHFKANELKTDNLQTINLIIILDGLNAIDAQTLLNEILSDSSKNQLELVENAFSFSPLPTVTEYTKTHIVHGSFSTFDNKLEKLGVDIPDKESPSNALSAAHLGDIIIWRIQEPDFTYHKEGQSSDLTTKIEGQMTVISKRITNAIENTHSNLPLRVILTTDHGRMLGKSQRTIEVPGGMIAHGRAAMGVREIEFGSKGYVVDHDIAYLSKDTFQLIDKTAAVIISDKSFVHEHYSEEVSPHGGLFPEEVILPWIVFERNLEKPNFTLKISGSGQANKEGKAILTITNPSSFHASLVSVELDFGNHKEYLESTAAILPRKVINVEFLIKSWPSVDQTQTGNGTAHINLPNGEIIIQNISLKNLELKSMYSRDNILEDLL